MICKKCNSNSFNLKVIFHIFFIFICTSDVFFFAGVMFPYYWNLSFGARVSLAPQCFISNSMIACCDTFEIIAAVIKNRSIDINPYPSLKFTSSVFTLNFFPSLSFFFLSTPFFLLLFLVFFTDGLSRPREMCLHAETRIRREREDSEGRSWFRGQTNILSDLLAERGWWRYLPLLPPSNWP